MFVCILRNSLYHYYNIKVYLKKTLLNSGLYNITRCRHGLDHMAVGPATTYSISAHHNQRCVFEPHSWRTVLGTTLHDKGVPVTFGRSVVFSGYFGFLHQ